MSARVHARSECPFRRTTRLIGATGRPSVMACRFGRKPRVSTRPEGSRSHARIPRPSTGILARRTPLCAQTARRLVRLSAMTIHVLTATGSQPHSRAIRHASRRRRSMDPMRPLTSTSSVLSSMTSSIRRAGCQEDIDDAPLAVDGERDFGLEQPSIQTGKQPGHRFVHAGVPRIEESAQVGALPADQRVEASPERLGDPPHLSHRDGCEITALGPRNERRGYAGPCRQVRLPPAFAHPDRSQRGADALVIHRASMTSGAHLALTAPRRARA